MTEQDKLNELITSAYQLHQITEKPVTLDKKIYDRLLEKGAIIERADGEFYLETVPVKRGAR